MSLCPPVLTRPHVSNTMLCSGTVVWNASLKTGRVIRPLRNLTRVSSSDAGLILGLYDAQHKETSSDRSTLHNFTLLSHLTRDHFIIGKTVAVSARASQQEGSGFYPRALSVWRFFVVPMSVSGFLQGFSTS